MTKARDLASSVNATAAGKNLIINGGMDVWQRGTTNSAAGSQFVADRWNTYRGGYASGLTVSRQLVGDNTNLPGIQYCTRLQRDSGNTAQQGIALAHAIESINSLSMAGKTVTLSFWARAGATFIASNGAIRPFVLSGTGIDEVPRNGLSNMVYVTNNFLYPTQSWVRYSVTGNIPSNASQVCLSIDGVVSGTAGATDYYEVTGVQLEIGSSATPFSRAGGDIAGELAKCQRYYYKLGGKQGVTRITSGFASSSTAGCWIGLFPVEMRTPPSGYIAGSPIWYDKVGGGTFTSYSFGSTSTQTYELVATNTSGLITGKAIGLTFDAATTYLEFNSEL